MFYIVSLETRQAFNRRRRERAFHSLEAAWWAFSRLIANLDLVEDWSDRFTARSDDGTTVARLRLDD